MSEFISDGDPSIVQVVPAAEYLEVGSVGDQGLSYLIDLFRLLTLTAPLTEDDITLYVEASLVGNVALHSNEAGFLGMLEVITVTLSDLPVDSLLDPDDLINKPIKVDKR